MRDIYRAFAKAGLGSGANLLISLARNKILAIVLGPSGMGTLSLLQQLQATAHPVATLGGDAPLVQGLASHSGEARISFFAAASKALFFSWFICATAFVVAAPSASQFLFENTDESNRFALMVMALPMLFGAIAAYLLAILTAVGAVGTLQKGQIFGGLAGLLASLPLFYFWKTSNTLALTLYLVATPLVTSSAALYFVWKLPSSRELLANLKFSDTSKPYLKAFLKFSATTMGTGFFVTATWLAIRSVVAKKYGLDVLGYFSATVSVSGLSLGLMGTALGSFYMPRFAAALPSERPKLIKDVLKVVAPIAFILLLIFLSFPRFIVQSLFSDKFLPAVPLLRWWAAGDFIRTVAYVFGYTIFAGRHLRFAFISELIFSALLLTGISAPAFLGLPPSTLGISYFFVYTLYLLTVVAFAKSKKYC